MSRDFAKEKLEFVSNLNGTSLADVFTLLSVFPMINLFSVLLKIAFFFNQINKLSQKCLETSFFWRSFLLDFLFCVVPLISVCTILDQQKTIVQYVLMFGIFSLYKYLFRLRKNDEKVEEKENNDEKLTFDLVEEKIVRLSLNTSRLWLYLLTCVTILAVDFRVFPRTNAKTESFGFSLMDLGVGFYIVCHAMKIIRNTQNLSDNKEVQSFSFTDQLKALPISLFKVLKSSSILLIFGLLRLVSVKSTNYVEHVTEYGVHWNFFFTIVSVKVLACPLQILIKKSALRSFLVGALILSYYQFFLTKKNFTAYLLSSRRRADFIDANKEGIFSCFGYLGIYLCAQSIYYQLSNLLNKTSDKKSSKADFKTSLKCLIMLVFYDLFYLAALILSVSQVQNVSRRLCNLSFACYILFSSTMLTTFFMAGILLVARLFSSKEEKNCNVDVRSVIRKLEFAFSFAKISDSKFIGLFIFLISNLITGLVNLSVNTLRTSDNLAFNVLCVYSFVSFAVPFVFYYFTTNRSNLNKEKKKINY